MTITSNGNDQLKALEDESFAKVRAGMLLQISPPCEIRRGILMLNSQNCQTLYAPAANDENEETEVSS
jgi:hypothetical protein